ncbi:amino acid adenylation domain-containing protein [Nocardia sp. JW2]|uniref:amino acid adenylation domain-containing protein n=1 Tax=Nocardia sp. JW2 TaxID=3450738 RepID=UPI003F434D0D
MTRASRASGTRARQRGKTLPQLLSVAVESNPGGVALSWSDGVSAPVRLTYGELDERANRLARLLIERGVGPEDVVAVGIGRSPESVLAMWAVTKAGAAFLPVDPNYPQARVSHMLADAGAVVGLSMSAAVDRLPGTVEWLCLDDPAVRRAAEEHPGDPVTFADRVRPLRLQHPAYVVYTSGSTGLPKGVVVTHAGLAGYCAEQRAHYGIEPTSRTLHFASPSFDAAVLELLMAVGAGATMVIAPAGILGGAELAEVLRRESVTHMFITTAALASLDPTGLDELAVVTTGGEACPPDLIRRWATGTRRFHDCYGPTETTIVTNISAPLEIGDTVNIGAPLRGVTEYVLDERLVRVPDGMIGELYIAGNGLARGYHRRPALTASRFVTDPFDPAGGRMYRTGDLVRRRPDGAIEFVGRNDFQVKVRGFRIELGEIDTVLTAHESVDFAVTVGHELDNGTTILAAYVHAAPGASIDLDDVLAHAKAGLPAHMVPTALTVLDTIPLTPVGKLDRAALPAPTLRAAEFRRPSGAMEELVAAVFTDLLHPADPIGADDDFFALGGNSLLATRVAARLGAELSTRVPAGHVFESPTVAGLAALLEPLKGAGGHAPLTRRGRPELIPLSPAQRRMWFLNQFDPNSTAETIPFALRLTGPFDAHALYAALSDLVGRHESLRTWYPVLTAGETADGDGVAEGVGHQVILPASEAVPEVLVDSLSEDELPLWLAEFAAKGFDVAAGVPLRVALAELGPRDHVVAIALHHITADGASITPLLRDLLGAYLARRNRSRPSWAPLPVQYADYTLWHRELLGAEDDPDSLAAAQIAFWRNTLAALPDRLALPTDRPRPPVFSGRGAEYGFQIPAAVHTALADLAQRTGTSEFMVVHAALAVLLSRVAHTDDIAIGTPVAGRGARELDDLIGMFVNTLVLRTQVDQRASFLELLRATKRADLAAFAHADLPFERLVELLDPVRSQAHHPLFQVALFFQNLDLPTLRLPGMEVAPVEFGGTVARFDLQLTVVPGTDPAEPMAALFTYATDLFDAESIENLAGRFTRLLSAVTAEPSLSVAEIDLLTDDERHQSIVAWNDTTHPVAPELVLDAYRRAVQAHPSATALVYEGVALTYRQFDERVNALARVLIGAGVGPESLVGLAVRRSPELVIGMYAVLTAGGAYVPLDPDHPADRIAYILDTARPACVLSTRADATALPTGIDVVLVDELDTAGVSVEPVRPEELRAPLHPEHPAYVIFTSGSTGKPKGVLISHAAIHNQLVWMLAKYPLVLGDVYLQKTATTFDVSLWGYFLPLRVGATLLLATPDGHRDPAYLIDLIDTHRVTVTDFVPSMLTVFAAQARAGRPEIESVASASARGEGASGVVVDAAPASAGSGDSAQPRRAPGGLPQRVPGNSAGLRGGPARVATGDAGEASPGLGGSTQPGSGSRQAHGLGGPASAAPAGSVGDRVTRERLLRSALATAPAQEDEPPAWSLRASRTSANPLPGPVDAQPASLSTLRDVFVIGEALPPETVDAMAEVCSARLHNLYGPTEAAVSVTYWPARAGERSVPIGLPQWNTRVYVLDERLRPVPPGVTGELYLAGDQLARGYVARPGLTADRFVADPFAADFGGSVTGARMYRTGDLVVWRKPTAGEPQRLDYLGRIDFQVKFRGQRIELGEIETALLASESVSQAVAMVAATELGDQLVAYVVPAPGRAADPDRLLASVSKTLPAYMVPAAITVLDELPLNPSGKLDRKALPAPHFTTRAFRAPATAAEKLIAALYGEVLGRKDIGADDDFFGLGGNSLVATRLVARLGAATGSRIPVRTLFEHPTVAALAATLDPAAVDATADTVSTLGSLDRPAALPLSPAQRRMWFLNRFDQGATGDGTAAYNLPFALRLTGNLDVGALTTALHDVLARHEVLRTVYPDTGDGPIQLILPADEVDLGITVHRIGEPADPFATTKLPIVNVAADAGAPDAAGRPFVRSGGLPAESGSGAELVEQITALASTAFDVTTEVPLRVRLFEVTGADPDAPTEYVLAVVVHHIAADASSMAPLVRDMTTAYLARAAGHAPDWASLPVQYADYALWQVDRLGAESDPESLAAQQVAFWQAELSGLPDLLELPADRPRPAVASLAGDRVPVRIDADTHAGLARIAQQTGSTVFMVLHTAFAVLLARLAGTADVVVGTPVAGRGERELDDLIGMFVNTVVLRTRYNGSAAFTDLLADQRSRDLAAFAAADVPFERLVEVLDPPRSTARHPLFQVGLSFQNVDHATLELPGLRIAPVPADLAVSQFDLHLIVGDGHAEDGTPTGIEGFFTYATDLFDAATVAGFAERLNLLLDAIVRDPARVVGDVDLRTAVERSSEIVSGAADLAMPTGTLADLPASARPEAIALVADLPEGRLELTYAEFEARANRLARHLISLGVGPESLVALALPRSVDLVVAMYAVARSGGAYVPIDPDQPADRTDYILHTAAPICVLSNGFRTDAAPVVRVDHPAVQSADPSPVTDADRRAPLRPENTAYVIFTSGSTGRPKGVAVPHAAVVNQLQWLRAEFETTAADAFLLKTPATFDLSVWEFWSAAVCGGRLVIAAPDGHRDPAYLDALIADANVTTLTAVPSLLDTLVGYWEATAPPLRRILAIGETLPAPLAQRLLNTLPDTRIDNLYGPTEAAVSITDHQVTSADTETVPIGTPEWNSRVYVLDERLRPVPPGVRGELYLGGVQLARGYLRKPALTAERFLADPFQPGARMYRTGDLVIRTPADSATHGELIYLGRTDFQVKVRGFRVEPGEVEAALLALPQVTQVAVLARTDAHYGDRLVAYVVPADSRAAQGGDITGASGGTAPGASAHPAVAGTRSESAAGRAAPFGAGAAENSVAGAAFTAQVGDGTASVPAVRPELDVAQVKSALREKLPAYLVPEAFVVLDALPRTVNGKLDRAALPAPVFESAAFRTPTTPTEQLIAGVYADILGVDDVGADDDFFALGGNSLLATRAAARIAEALNRAVGVRLLFEAPTVTELALRVHRADELSAARPVAGPRPAEVPLSLAQQRMWLLNQLDPDATVYNIPAAIRLTGTLDLPALEAAVRDLFTRHEVLRTRYPVTPHDRVRQPAALTRGTAAGQPATGASVDATTAHRGTGTAGQPATGASAGATTAHRGTGTAGQPATGASVDAMAGRGTEWGPVQEVLAPGAVDLDLTPVPVTADDVLAEVRCTASTGFDVTAAPPVRLRLLRLGADEHVLVFVAHHIAADGFSMGPLTRDLVLAYTARTSGAAPAWTPLPLQYADYAVWQRDTLGDETDPASIAANQLAYWTTELADLPDEIDLPTDRPRPAVQSFAGATTGFDIDADLHAGLAALARREGVTLFMVVQAALATLLARLSDTDDVAIGTPIAGRGARELDDLVGMFVNTLVLRSRIAGDEPFTTLLAATRDTDLRAFAHADVPFERVVDAVQPARSTSRHPLFQVALSFENLAPVTVELPGLAVHALDARTADAKFDLLLTVREQQRNGGMYAEFTYATDLFDESTVRTLGARFTRLLAAVAADPTAPVGDIDLLDERELAAQTTFAGPPAVPARTLAQLMGDAVRANPSGIALRGEGRGFTYTDLDAAANQLARALIARGAGPEVPVAVAIRRSVESVLALWAIARTGAVIVPIDPGYPLDRIAHMVADSGATLGVTLAAELADLPALPAAGGWVALDDRAFTAEVAANPGVALREIELLGAARPGGAAYMIYTSGSTGLPKGVVVTHAGVANFCAEQVERYRLDKATRALAFASPSFDASMLELLLALGGAGTLVVAPADSVGGTDLAELIRTEGVTHAFLTPTVLATLEPEGLPDLRVLIVGGEHLPGDLAAGWDALPQRRLHNAYGPTEATIAATISAPLHGTDVHMGGPIRGIRALTLDPRLHPVPEGATGELYVGGIQLARGYHQRAGLTAARFVADPHGPAGARLYRTGDLVRRRGDVLEYLGRNDFQVKIRGLRIELGEIDAVLAAVPGVSWVSTMGRDNGAGSTMLVSYVQGTDLEPSALTAAAAEALPDYMVPAAVVVLDELPLTPSGKLDRRALPDPVLSRREFRPPRSSAERAVARVIGEVLGHDRVGVDDDFFALGGDSITAIQVVSRAADAGVTLRPRDLFAARTVGALAERAQLTAEATTRTGALPLTATAAQLLEAGEQAVEPRALLLDVPADCPDEAVAAVAAAVMNQHPMLWAVLDRTESDPVLRIPPAAERTGGAFRRLAGEDGEASLPVDDIVAAAAAALDPDEGRNIHFILTGDGPSTLVVVANALVLDEVSWRAVVDQLTTAWSRGRHAAPSAPDAGLDDLIRRLADYPSSPAARAEREYWHRAVRARTADSGDLRQRRRVSLSITGEGTAAVGTVAEAYRATVDEVLLTAVALALHTAADSAAVRAIGSVVRLRADQRVLGRHDAQNVVGGFTTDFPLALRLDGVDPADALVGGPAAGTALSQIKELCRTVPAGGAGFGLLRYLDADAADTVRTVDRGRFALRVRDLRPARVHTDVAVDDLVLVLTVDATADGMVARFDYAATVLDADAVKHFAEHWIRALGGLAEHGLRPDAGGFTPSDFALVRLGQTELDRLVRRYPRLSDIWPVTPLQSGMLFHALLAENSVDPYITQIVLDLDPSVDTERLHTAAQTVLDRHDNLRVAFATDPAGTPLQVVIDDVDVPWQVIDADEATYERIRSADLATHFDMAVAPQLRFTLVRTPQRAHLVVTSHHILIDGWSMPLLLQELLAAYTVGRTRRLPKPAPYRDYLAWLTEQDLDAARQAWRGALTGLAEPTPLAPVEKGREIASGTGETGFALTPADTAALTRLAADLGVTVNTVVQAAWGLLIARLVDRDDVVFGATVSGRPAALPGVERMVGLFLNAIPVRVRVRPEHTVAELLRTLQDEQAALFDYHYLGLGEIQEIVGVDALFDSLVVFESFPVDRAAIDRAASGSATITGLDATNGTHYPLTVQVVAGEQLRVSVKYLRDVFDAYTAHLLSQRFSLLLARFTADPQSRLGALDVLLADERGTLTALNATDAPELLDESTLLTLFDAQVARTPDAVAVIDGEHSYTYEQFDARSRKLAATLSALGAGPEVLIAVAMRRGIDLVTSIYAVLRTGTAYVPVDPDHPAERTERVLAAAAPLCVLTTTGTGFHSSARVVEIDTLAPASAPPAEPAPDNLAYVIHTSGSTGKPKGVMLTHRQLVAQFRWAQRDYLHSPGDVVLHKTPVTFDISTWELLWPLQTGAAVVIARPDGHRDPDYLAEVITEHSVTTVHFVPSMLDAFLTDRRAGELPSLRRVFAAGEALQAATARRFAEVLPGADLVNWYGPAEATVVTATEVTAAEHIPIGEPVANTRVHVLDRHLRPVPPGIAGELYLEGVQLARGYLAAPALTAERFVAHPGGGRLYRTGDVVRLDADGALEYLGRSDFQVKLRGQRIELGEVEAVLRGHPAVRHAAVALVHGPTGDRLVGYVVPAETRAEQPGTATPAAGYSIESGANTGGLDEAEVLSYARTALPSYMVPATLVVLAALPLNASGKLDRKALPVPAATTRPYRPPTTPVQRAVAEVFAEVLGAGKVGLDDDFFELGGNSLVATKAISRLRTRVGADVRVQWFFSDATVAALAERIDATQAGAGDYDLESDDALGVLLPIRNRVPHGTEAGGPLFCVHPMYGLAWCYAGLAQYIPARRPIFGLQSPALSESGYLPGTLAAMARRYVIEIKAVQPQGPYRLMGWSLGGVLAHAVATELQADGEQVSLLAMLDSHPDIDVPDFHTAVRDALAELGVDLSAAVATNGVRELSDEALAALHAIIPANMAVLTPERVRRIYRSAVRSAELIAEHRPAVFRGRLEYFSALGHEKAAANWARYVDGEIRDRPVAVVHDQMTSPQALAEIGPRLAELLDAGDRATGAR